MEKIYVDFATIDEYITAHPAEIQRKLQELRATINSAAPDAQEKISYNMPTFALNGNLVYFAVAKNHIGFYGASRANQELNAELSPYANDKGSLRFPLDKPIPLDLVRRVVELRVAENLKKAELKASKPKKVKQS